MGRGSAIQWTDNTFNPWIGCTKVGPGFNHCYAETMMDSRYGRVKWGAGNPRSRTSAANWRKPLQWNRETMETGITRVFCSSLADVFDNEVPQAWRDDLWKLIEATPALSWQLLTKRGVNVPKMMPERWRNAWPRHVGLMHTIVNQAEADRDVPRLLSLKADFDIPWVGLSCEPLLGPIDLRIGIVNLLRVLDWVIVGGESGPNARPMHPDWARSLRDQCAEAGVPFFFKQWGEWAPEAVAASRTGAETALYIETDGSTRPARYGARGNAVTIQRNGKKAAGRLLDGCEWNEFPHPESPSP